MKKVHRAILGTLLLSALILGACEDAIVRGSRDLVTESRPVSGFDGVTLASSGDVIIRQGDEESLTIETDDNVMEHVTAEVRGGTLVLGFEPGIRSISPSRLSFEVTVDDLSEVTVSGSGEITMDRLDGDDLELLVSGSGEIRLESLEADTVDVRISGSGEVELEGEVSEQDLTISGSGEYRAGDLRSEIADVTISGSGQARIWVTESLDVTISGSGDLDYYGSPRTNISTPGSGDVDSLGDK